jgi:RNA polymerase sigma-70 factor (ECF subfamily)
MGQPFASETSPTLLEKRRRDPTDQAAWSRFVTVYGPKIYGWCRTWGLQEADAQDVTQNVLVKLAKRMRTFAYDPAQSFRGWLKTLTHHAWSDFWSGRRQVEAAGGASGSAALEAVAAREDLVARLEEAFDGELLEQAMLRVRLRVAGSTWEAFRLTALEGLPGAAAAERLKTKVANVYVAKSEVQKMLREEVRRLEQPDAV